MSNMFFQGRVWTNKEIEEALNERSNQSRKITHLVKGHHILEERNKRLREENFKLHGKLEDVSSAFNEVLEVLDD